MRMICSRRGSNENSEKKQKKEYCEQTTNKQLKNCLVSVCKCVFAIKGMYGVRRVKWEIFPVGPGKWL